MTINASHTCFCWFAHRPLASGADRAALLKATKWSPGGPLIRTWKPSR
jgi:hypothetical protein